MTVAKNSKEQRALILGETPIFTCEYIFIGSVLEWTPVKKTLIITSSKLIAKAKNIPERTAGKTKGKIMSKKILVSPAPKSFAASTYDLSIPARRALTRR